MSDYNVNYSKISVGIGAIALLAQLTAPHCPQCRTKLIIIINYCINCKKTYQL